MAKREKPRKTATSRTTTINVIDTDEIENNEAELPIGDDMTLARRQLMIARAKRCRKKARGKKKPQRKKRK